MSVKTIWVANHVADPTYEHAHNYYQLVFCQKGAGKIKVASALLDTHDNEVFFLKPLIPHAILQPEALGIIEIKFLLVGPESDSLASALAMLPDHFFLENSASVRSALQSIVLEGAGMKPFCNMRTNAMVTLFLTRCLQEKLVCPSERLETMDLATSPIASPEAERFMHHEMVMLQDYIDEHLSGRVTLEDLAREIHFNKSHIISLFRSLLGTTPMRYIGEIRLNKAKALLAGTEMTITEISAITGFQSIHYFSRYFKEKTQLSPLDYRRRHAPAAGAKHGPEPQ